MVRNLPNHQTSLVTVFWLKLDQHYWFSALPPAYLLFFQLKLMYAFFYILIYIKISYLFVSFLIYLLFLGSDLFLCLMHASVGIWNTIIWLTFFLVWEEIRKYWHFYQNTWLLFSFEKMDSVQIQALDASVSLYQVGNLDCPKTFSSGF